MTTILISISIVLSIVGLIGCILPGVPGPPLSFISLLLLQFAIKPYSITFLIIWAIIIVVVVVIDYYLPIWFAKKYGATRYGIIGSIVGMLLGILFTPIGMLAGLVLGAIIGDLIAGRTETQAMRSGLATVFGTLLTIGFKFVLACFMSWFLFYEIVGYYF